jgi:hypothetical protein
MKNLDKVIAVDLEAERLNSILDNDFNMLGLILERHFERELHLENSLKLVSEIVVVDISMCESTKSIQPLCEIIEAGKVLNESMNALCLSYTYLNVVHSKNREESNNSRIFVLAGISVVIRKIEKYGYANLMDRLLCGAGLLNKNDKALFEYKTAIITLLSICALYYKQ